MTVRRWADIKYKAGLPKIHPVPIVALGRCLVSIDVAISWSDKETWQYTKNPFTGHWVRIQGDKSTCAFYGLGNGETP